MISRPYSILISDFRADAERWLGLPSRASGGTAYYGVMARATEQIDKIIKQAAANAMSVVGEDAATRAALAIGEGKPFDKFTMGQNITLLEKLQSELKQAVSASSPQPKEGASMYPKELSDLLRTVSKERNNFAHGRFESETGDQNSLANLSIRTSEFLKISVQALSFPLFQQLDTSIQNMVEEGPPTAHN